jgi:sigma-B regulation protein RsbU (phosphoserine phosphatase)
MDLATGLPSARVLVADDQADVLEAVRLLLRRSGLDGDFVTSPAAVLDRLRDQAYELLLLDLNYTRDTTSGGEGLELLQRIRQIDPVLPVVVMTGWGSIDTAVEAMRRGAKSFVQKPWDNTTLLDLLRREIEDARAARLRDVRTQREQEDARLIQRSLLPQALPAVAPFSLGAKWQPASGYGGDWYDVSVLGSDVVGVAIADVAGKGLPAALLMSNLQAAVRAFWHPEAPPRVLCENVNRLLCRHMVSGRFVTFCAVRLDCRTRTLTWSNAGHNPPLVVRADGEVVRLQPGGTVMGVFDDALYREDSVALRTGDRVVLYTDGITEALSAAGEEYDEPRLIAAVAAHRGTTAAATTEGIFADVLGWAGGPLGDDATLITVVVD